VNYSHRVRKSILISVAIFLSGCAGSATHSVVTAYQASDEAMSCCQLDAETVKTQVIVDDVNKDKEDISGVDVVDTILWFPFNLIAKDQNYKECLAAADKRLERLYALKKEKGCITTTESVQKMKSFTEELNKLNEQFKNGAIGQEEYKQAKARLFDGCK